jgi:hypothetical protein
LLNRRQGLQEPLASSTVQELPELSRRADPFKKFYLEFRPLGFPPKSLLRRRAL